MNLVQRFLGLFARQRPPRPVRKTPPRPPDWKMTFDDLMAEAKAGKRPSIGQPELDWARDYERSLIPDGFRFPQKGDLYEALADHAVSYVTDWAAPYSGGGDTTLRKGERVWVHAAPLDEKPIGANLLPVDYKTFEQRIVPEAERSCPKYGGFHFYLSTVELNRDFRLVQTGFRGRWFKRG